MTNTASATVGATATPTPTPTPTVPIPVVTRLIHGQRSFGRRGLVTAPGLQPGDPRSYRYTIQGGLPVADNRGRFAVEPAGPGARIAWESGFEPLDPAAEPEFNRMWRVCCRVVLGDLKTLIEAS